MDARKTASVRAKANAAPAMTLAEMQAHARRFVPDIITALAEMALGTAPADKIRAEIADKFVDRAYGRPNLMPADQPETEDKEQSKLAWLPPNQEGLPVPAEAPVPKTASKEQDLSASSRTRPA